MLGNVNYCIENPDDTVGPLDRQVCGKKMMCVCLCEEE